MKVVWHQLEMLQLQIGELPFGDPYLLLLGSRNQVNELVNAVVMENVTTGNKSHEAGHRIHCILLVIGFPASAAIFKKDFVRCWL